MALSTMPQLYDAFISYGRADSKAFAEPLCQLLTKQGYRIWFDQNDIPLGVDYQQQIDDDLERSHNFVFIMSPHSVNSDYCRMEVERAVARHKRIIPILHVDELKRETWQQRNPEGTDAEWAEYQAQKRHLGDVRNPRIHPIIGKLNWIYMREGQDDLKAGLAGLIKIFERQKDYVECHTQLLVNALEWENQQRRSQFLLIGNQREQAEEWLKIRFKDDLPPCTPSDLHSEFITESVKNAHNLMCQVFLAHAAEDHAVMEKVRRSLWREGITVWAYDSDIEMGADFRQAIQEGIEQADNLVYLLSPDSIGSEFCQQELDYALSLKKRVIPILVRPTPLEQQPQRLQELQYIDLSDNEQEEDYLLDESQLLRIIKTNEQYFNTHKVFLSKALKWERQHRNPSLLLRGYNLKQAETWLKTASKRSTYLPTDIQTEFITESLRQPPAESLDVFVSYSRSDSEFARQLNESLQIYGKLTWFDQESIATSSADFQQEIYQGIEASDNFLFILSPQSVNSPYCKDEVEFAAKLNKRFLTILYQPFNTDGLHPELKKVQWLDFTDPEREFGDHFNQVVRVLDTDREHVRNHTRWSQRAIEWVQKQQSTDLLLRGNEFAIAENWLETAIESKKQPAPTEIQQNFLQASRDAIAAEKRKEKRQQARLRSLVGFTSVVAVVAVIMSIWAVKNQREAISKEVSANVATANASFSQGHYRNALLNSLRAARTFQDHRWLKRMDKTLQHKIVNALQQPLYRVRSRNSLNAHTQLIQGLSFSPDGETLASVSVDGEVFIWNQDGIRQTNFSLFEPINDEAQDSDGLPPGNTPSEPPPLGYEEEFFNLWDGRFSSDGQHLLLLFQDRLEVWTLSGKRLKALQIPNVEEMSFSSWSPNGQYLAYSTYEGEYRLFKLDENYSFQPIPRFGDYRGTGLPIAFSPDSQHITLPNSEGNIDVWTVDGKFLKTITIPDFDSNETYVQIALSNNGEFVAVASSGIYGSIELWHSENGFIRELEHKANTSELSFNPSSDYLTVSLSDNTIALWDLNTLQDSILSAHADEISQIAFTPDGSTLASSSYDTTIELWDLNNPLSAQWSSDQGDEFLALFETELDPIEMNLYHQSEGGYLTLEYDHMIEENIIGIWSIDKTLQSQIGPFGDIWSAQISNDGQTVVTIEYITEILGANGELLDSNDSSEIFDYRPRITSVQVWNIDGTLRANLEDFESFNSIALSDDGTTLLLMQDIYEALDENGDVLSPENESEAFEYRYLNLGKQLWHTDGRLLANLDNFEPFEQIILSPNGNTLITKGRSGAVQRWSVDGSLLQTLTPEGENTSLFSNPRGPALVTAIAGSSIQYWSSEGEPLHTFLPDTYQQFLNSNNEEESTISNIYFARDNQSIALEFYDGTIVYWPFGEPPETVSWDKLTAMSDQFPEFENRDGMTSPDGQWRFSFDNSSREVIVTHLKTGNETVIDTGHRGEFHNVYFSPDGKYLATSNFDNTIKLWSMDMIRDQNRLEIPTMTFKDHAEQMGSFSPDGNFLVTADETHELFMVRALQGMSDLDALMRKGCAHLGSFLQPDSTDGIAENDDLVDGDRTLCKNLDPIPKSEWPHVPKTSELEP